MKHMLLSLLFLYVFLLSARAQDPITYDPCPFGVQFNGVNAYAHVSWPNYNQHQSVTVAVWARYEQDHDGTEKVLVQKAARGPGGNCEYTLKLDASGNVSFQAITAKSDGTEQTESVSTSGFVMKKDTFYHLAATFDQTSLQAVIYINGEQKATQSFVAPIKTAFFFAQKIPIVVGCAAQSFSNRNGVNTYAYEKHFKGTLDELVIAPRALTGVQLDTAARGLMTQEVWKRYGVISYFKMNEGSGNRSENNTGIVTGTGTGQWMEFSGAKWAACTPSAKYVDIAGLRVYADEIPLKVNPRTVKGKVYVVPKEGCASAARVLYFEGDVVVDTVANTISGKRRVYGSEIGNRGMVVIMDTTYTFNVVDETLLFDNYIYANFLKLGLLDVSIKAMKVQCDGILMDAQIGLPQYLNAKDSPFPLKIQVDSLFLNKSGIDLVGGIQYNKPARYLLIPLDSLKVEYDWTNDIFKGRVILLTPVAKWPFSVQIVQGKLDAFEISHVAVPPKGLLPLGTTGWAIDSVGGGIADMRIKPWTRWQYKLGARAAPYIPIKPSSFVDVRISATYQFGTIMSADASASLLGHRTAGINYTLTPEYWKIRANVSLFEVIEGELAATGKGGGIYGNFDATAKIPKIERWYLRWINLLYGEGSLFSTSNYITGQYLAGTTKIALPGVPRLFYTARRTTGLKFELDWGRSSAVVPLEAQKELKLFRPTDRSLTEDRPATAFGRTSVRSVQNTTATAQVHSFELATPTEHLILSAMGNQPPDLSVYLANGDTLTPGNVAGRANVQVVTDTEEGATTYILTNPAPGNYYVWSNTADSIHVSRINTPPRILLGSVTDNKASKKLSITYTATDADDAGALVAFGLDDNRSNADGFVLRDSLALSGNSLTLDYAGVRSGTYYLYATVTDAIGQHHYVYHDTPIQVLTAGAPKAPSGLAVKGTDSSVILSFTKNNDYGYDYLVHYSTDTAPLTHYSMNIAGGDTDRVELSLLPPGRPYKFAVTAIDADGNESALSNIVTLNWTSDTANNAPFIAPSGLDARVQVGTAYKGKVKATDADGDALTYTVTRGPAGLQVDGSGNLSWTPGEAGLGHRNICVQVSDGKGGVDSVRFELLVYAEDWAKPSITLDRSAYDGYTTPAIVEVSDLLAGDRNEVKLRLSSTTDPTGIELSAQRSSADRPDFLARFGFTSGASTATSLRVGRGDSVWVRYTSAASGEAASQYALFNYVEADFLFQDSACGTGDVPFYNASKGAGLTYRWDFGDNTTSTEAHPRHRFAAGAGKDKFAVRLIVTNAANVSDTITREISIVQLPALKLSASGPLTLCQGGNVSFSSNAPGLVQWYRNDTAIAGANTASYTATQAGRYHLQALSGAGCSAVSDTLTITAASGSVAIPGISATGSTTFCQGGSLTLTSSATSGNQWFRNGAPITGATSATYTATESGLYRVQATAGSCTALSDDSVRLTVLAPAGTLSAPATVLCPGTPVTLTASGGASYQWYLDGTAIAGATSATFAANMPGVYSADLVSADGCTAKAGNTLVLTVPPKPKAAFTFDSYCEAVPVTFANSTPDTAGLHYHWTFGDGATSTDKSPVHVFNRNGAYTVTLVAALPGCAPVADTLTKTLTIEKAAAGIRYPAVETAIGLSQPLAARPFGQAYLWMPATDLSDARSRTPLLTPTAAREYRVEIRAASGCVTVDTLEVKLVSRIEVAVPTAFTPNGNGANDLLRPILVNITELTSFRVYNRWGQLVFETKERNKGWDGTLKGQPQPAETYTWTFTGTGADGKAVRASGKTVLIR